MRCRTTRDLGVVDSWQSPLIVTRDGRRIVAAGTLIDQSEHPETNCVALVRNGEAVPMDEECRLATAMSADQIARAVAARAKLDVHNAEAVDDADSD